MGGANTREIVMNQTNSMVAEIIVNASLSCNGSTQSTQSITIGCDPGNVQWESSPTCLSAMDGVRQSFLDKYAFVASRWTGARTVVTKPIDEDLTELLEAMKRTQRQFCKACDFSNLSQTTVVASTTECKALDDIKNVMDQRLSVQLQQVIDDNQDFMAPLISMFGGGNKMRVVDNLAARVSALISTEIVRKARNHVTLNQRMQYQGGRVDANSQSNAVSSVQNFFSHNKIFNNIFSEVEWKRLQELYNEQNTIDTLGNAALVATTAVLGLISSIAGNVVLATAAVAGAVVVLIIVLVLYSKMRRWATEDIEEPTPVQAAAVPVPTAPPDNNTV